MQKVTHSLEAIAEGIRDLLIPCNEEIINTILSSVDKLKEGLFDLLKGGKGQLEDVGSLLEILKGLEPVEGAQAIVKKETTVDARPSSKNVKGPCN